jgi:hypothetical protein
MRRFLIILATAVLVAALAACGDDEDTADTAGTTSGTTASRSGTTGPAQPEGSVRVYFARDGMIATAGGSTSADDEPTAAMEALLVGPGEFESEIGMTTEIPVGTELVGLGVEEGEAQVNLSSAFASGGGSLSMQLRVAQVVFTLTRFSSIDTVTILLDGETATEGVGGEGIPAVGVDRDDFTNVTPAILVESPVPGEEVSSPITISGIANTFEANVRYTVTDPEGLIIAEGFTTATAGNGTWGDFEVEAGYDTDRSGLGAVIAFQDDTESGGQRDVYEVPVRMG